MEFIEKEKQGKKWDYFENNLRKKCPVALWYQKKNSLGNGNTGCIERKKKLYRQLNDILEAYIYSYRKSF